MINYFASILGGLLFTSIMYAVTTYILEKFDRTSSFLGSDSDFAIFSAIAAAVLGVVFGAISATVITFFQLNLVNAVKFGFLYGIIILLMLKILMGGDGNSIYAILLTFPINILNALFISYFFVKNSLNIY